MAMAAPAAADSANSVQEVVVTGSRVASPGLTSASPITNTQVQGVDEGDIVKLRGETMIILRRGRLFTVSIADGAMKPIDSINAYPPGVDARDDWYDEMLLSGDQIVVIGYSYARGGTEINRFRLGVDGHLEFEDAYQLKSNDYYSSRNYASRLIGSKLILYSPLYIDGDSDPLANLPAMRRWTGKDSEFHRIVSATSIYIPASMRNDESISLDALHAVTTCDLSAPELDCHATGVLGPGMRDLLRFQLRGLSGVGRGRVASGRGQGHARPHLPHAARRLGAAGYRRARRAGRSVRVPGRWQGPRTKRAGALGRRRRRHVAAGIQRRLRGAVASSARQFCRRFGRG